VPGRKGLFSGRFSGILQAEHINRVDSHAANTAAQVTLSHLLIKGSGAMFLKVFILTAAVMIFPGCDLQNKLLYYSGSSAPSEESLKADNLKRWQSSASDYRGLIAANDVGGAKGTIVVFHGNGGIAADRTYYLKDLSALGYRVILAEYPGYGGRKGELGEKSFVHDAAETVRLVSEKYNGPLFLLGESLGCGVAAAVAKVTPVKIDGIVLITPWDTLASIAREKFPFLPVRLFLTDSYDTIGNLTPFKGRIAVIGAERDEVIPLAHAKNLYDSLPSAARRMWTMQGAGHNDWPMHVNSTWWKEIMDYVGNNDKG
jgi:pimeloyl-ACP methyl ester carboxylesterase